ncbi:MAG TPA: glycerophosphodiester phosphodiesterase family protein [Candidatus Saccharimonadales bacterium]|nr:glycerophosphodiester phosphodiesterase family protein [Candidatus Saccharimonadales bacterium]
MKVIGHRGAASLAPENSLASLQAAINAGVDAIEFDVRVTADHQLVLSHDNSLQRLFGINQKISSCSLEQLKTFKSLAGEPLATLDQALILAAETNLVIEGKDHGWAEPLAKTLKNHPNIKNITVISFNYLELHQFNELYPATRCFGLSHHSPLHVINAARKYKFAGIDIFYLMLNPLVYYLARRHKLEIIVYNVNQPWLAKLIKHFYPEVSITTDVPQKLQLLRSR